MALCFVIGYFWGAAEGESSCSLYIILPKFRPERARPGPIILPLRREAVLVILSFRGQYGSENFSLSIRIFYCGSLCTDVGCPIRIKQNVVIVREKSADS